jgi:prephenate dehydrogenase
MARLIKIGVVVGAVGWLYSIGALDPGLWKDTFQRERERLPEQIKEALAAGKRAAAKAEEDLDREVREAFDSRS